MECNDLKLQENEWNSSSSVAMVVTIAGLVLGLLGVIAMPDVGASVPLLVMSLAMDAVDGTIARAGNGATRYGSVMDWTVDTAISYSIAMRLVMVSELLAVSACVMLVAVQYLSASGIIGRASGRTVVTVMACAVMVFWQ